MQRKIVARVLWRREIFISTRFFEFLLGLGRPVRLPQSPGQFDVGLSAIGVPLIAKPVISHPVVESCTDVLMPILLDLQARSIVLNCLVEFSLLDKHESQAVVCPGLVRIEADRMAQNSSASVSFPWSARFSAR